MGLTFVHRDQDIRIRTKGYGRDVFAILKRKCTGLITVAQG